MKKITNTLYLIFGCAAMLCSCGQEEVSTIIPDGSDRRIVFHTSLPELATKVAGIATDLPDLQLTAFDESDENFIYGGQLKEYFKNEKVEKNADSEKFVSDRCVWPAPGQEDDLLHFFAYYPGLHDSVLVNKTAVSDDKVVTLGYKIKGFSVTADIAEQVDFVTAYTTGTMNANLFAGIDLKFRHQLSRIEVQAKGANKSCNVEIAGVKFGNVTTQGDFDFQTSDADGVWSETSKDAAEYIFREGDEVVTVGADPVSIMGSKVDADNDNCAMLIPSSLTAWAYDTDTRNDSKGLYVSVLLRVIDATNTPGKGEQRYPYTDNSQGLNSPNIPVVYLAVKSDGKSVSRRLYKLGDNYFTDKEHTEPYALPSDETVKEFGWASVPISGEWEPGYIYTYTLDYSYGVGVHGPETPGDISPMAGDPIISDRVGVSLGFKDWQNGGSVGIVVPGN